MSVKPITFFAAGRAKTKGSIKFVKSASTGEPVPTTNQPLQNWQGVVSHACYQAKPDHFPEGVDIEIRFFFARPKGHFGTGKNAGKLKKSAPPRPVTRAQGDIDKLIRAVLDGLTGTAFPDDSEVSDITSSKRFTDEKNPYEGARITLRKATE